MMNISFLDSLDSWALAVKLWPIFYIMHRYRLPIQVSAYLETIHCVRGMREQEFKLHQIVHCTLLPHNLAGGQKLWFLSLKLVSWRLIFHSSTTAFNTIKNCNEWEHLYFEIRAGKTLPASRSLNENLCEVISFKDVSNSFPVQVSADYIVIVLGFAFLILNVAKILTTDGTVGYWMGREVGETQI